MHLGVSRIIRPYLSVTPHHHSITECEPATEALHRR